MINSFINIFRNTRLNSIYCYKMKIIPHWLYHMWYVSLFPFDKWISNILSQINLVWLMIPNHTTILLNLSLFIRSFKRLCLTCFLIFILILITTIPKNIRDMQLVHCEFDITGCQVLPLAVSHHFLGLLHNFK